MEVEAWLKKYRLTSEKLAAARKIMEDIRAGTEVATAVRRHPLPQGGLVGKHVLVAVYQRMVESGEWREDSGLQARIRMKPMRTLSGVTTVTVLTRAFPCPGKCIFCPDEESMPKSYLADEPGAARACQNDFNPYRQVSSRLETIKAVGHPTDKIELLILGGTWSVYPRKYQERFVLRCFDAMNGIDSKNLAQAQRLNETAVHRNVGLVIETRPDEITPDELAWLRYLGVTKVQIGVQSLDDEILALNRRGHTTAETIYAAALLRAAGFKIVMHWMPNLYGSSPEKDQADFERLWAGYCPDEIKIYPTQLLQNTDLFKLWQAGKYRPYDTAELVQLIASLKTTIPPYCRVNRVIRDIPSQHIISGSLRSSLRQDVIEELSRRGQKCGCIRCREIGQRPVDPQNLVLDDYTYRAAEAREHFLSFVTQEGGLAAYLRLSLPLDSGELLKEARGLACELKNAALVREVHVYGQSLPVGSEQSGAAQHIGLGTRLLEAASDIARQEGYEKLAVISAVGTRKYYEHRGFHRQELYLVKNLISPNEEKSQCQ